MKSDRHNAILDIISKNEVDTQEMLQELLRTSGFNVTQATVSRDIKDLGLIKTVGTKGNYKYSLPIKTSSKSQKNALYSILHDGVTEIDYALNTVVVKCHVGMAQAVCAKLDNAEFTGIVGTIAGDDTIFILMRTQEDANKFVTRLEKLIAG